MSAIRRTLTAVSGLLTTLSAMALFASAASAQVPPPDLPHARPIPPPAPVSGGFPLWAVVLTLVVAMTVILAGIAFNVRLRLAQPQPADA